ncbi:hypothetical protein QCB45_06640 [Thiomicrorhabdus sp. ZW0627]|uniref:hypothetical protein n=1 Tax=Thiomicrorhabdus sp. ZW0627 TaxID=3039774 RepID=UPI0024373C5A|nr:hypothetical protein [Thiomicrorhabdus sp. ZW0627]MDG6774003.1 hypothetical protein [Thiomicrorhabdus sp. ZW0627]
MLKLLLIVPLFALTVSCSSNQTKVEDVDSVLIDQSESAYMVYAGIPKNKVDQVKEKLLNAPAGIYLVPWTVFTQNKDKYIRSHIVKNEYPTSNVEKGISEFLLKYPGTPIGLAWNGGIAFTRNDYEHTKQIFKQYQADAESYEQNRNTDPRSDPINPQGHFGPLLGW